MEIIQRHPYGGPVLIRPTVHKDDRGYFYESFNEKEFKEKVADVTFVQDNQSKSQYGTLRGLHFQHSPHAQAKLVRVVKGSVVDVAVDIRQDSPTYGKWFGAYLSEENNLQFFIPRGFAHGFVALEDDTVFQYKCDNLYNKDSEGGFMWNDPDVGITWDLWVDPKDIKLSSKDMARLPLSEIANAFKYEADKENCENITYEEV